jgi:8-oxo-dGTP diphosphatase
VAQWRAGEPALLEPHKCRGWAWYALEALPQPLFALAALSIERFKGGPRYIDGF